MDHIIGIFGHIQTIDRSDCLLRLGPHRTKALKVMFSKQIFQRLLHLLHIHIKITKWEYNLLVGIEIFGLRSGTHRFSHSSAFADARWRHFIALLTPGYPLVTADLKQNRSCLPASGSPYQTPPLLLLHWTPESVLLAPITATGSLRSSERA